MPTERSRGPACCNRFHAGQRRALFCMPVHPSIPSMRLSDAAASVHACGAIYICIRGYRGKNPNPLKVLRHTFRKHLFDQHPVTGTWHAVDAPVLVLRHDPCRGRRCIFIATISAASAHIRQEVRLCNPAVRDSGYNRGQQRQ